MIYDRISNAHLYLGLYPKLDEVLKDIQTTLSEPSSTLIKNFINFKTGLEAEKSFELHRVYYDVHVVLEGTESFKMTHKDQLIHQTDYDEEHDILFGNSIEHCLEGYIKPGMFVVFFEHEAHKVGYDLTGNNPISKIVYKVRV
ncbi:YhcH/YjgK/YiaL family protein [Erysipelothrix sp. P66]|uniref:YhcH/YjgK/YiaL family protein n=1 Tax=Erysipelothrix sp. P66 TaxID=3141531 RepID=UPI00315CE305